MGDMPIPSFGATEVSQPGGGMNPIGSLLVVDAPASGRPLSFDPLALGRHLGIEVQIEAAEPSAVLLLPTGATPEPEALGAALEELRSRLDLVGVVEMEQEGPSESLPLEIVLHPERVGALLVRADVARACGVEIPGSGSLARAAALLCVATGFDLSLSARPLSHGMPREPMSPAELAEFSRRAAAAFAIEDLKPALRSSADLGSYARALLECASRLLPDGRLTEGFTFGARAQALLDGRDHGLGQPPPTPGRSERERPEGLLREPARDPEVTLVLTTYNRAAMLGRALESVACQTFRDLEVIVVQSLCSSQPC